MSGKRSLIGSGPCWRGAAQIKAAPLQQGPDPSWRHDADLSGRSGGSPTIGKVSRGEDLVDVIYSAVNGVPRVDDVWFEHAVEAEVLNLKVKFCPPEELIWAKSFVMERERFDGADVMHLLRACGRSLDWTRLLDRFGPHWRLLLGHLIIFGFVYPAERSSVPDAVMSELFDRLQAEMKGAPRQDGLCQGTLLTWRQYLVDIERWGFEDARVVQGYMTPQEIAAWTAAFRES